MINVARGTCTFRKRDLTVAIKAVMAAGCAVARAEIDPATGKIIVVTGRPSEPNGEEVKAEMNEWDEKDGTPSAAIR